MQTQMLSRRLFTAASLYLLLSACSSNAFVAPTIPAAPARPCELPFPDKWQGLPAQSDLSKPQDGGDTVSVVLAPDYQALNAEAAHGNSNRDFAAAHCIAGAPPAPVDVSPPKPDKPATPWWHVW